MKAGIEATIKVLVETRNEAAVGVLIACLDSKHPDIQQSGLDGILGRRSVAGHSELVRRWNSFSKIWKQKIAEHGIRISGAVRDAIVDADEAMCRNGCEVLKWTRDYDLFPVLINAAEDRSHARSDLAAKTLLDLAEVLFEELAGGRDANNRRDPQLRRKFVIASLEQSLKRFDKHQRQEILEAFLTLARSDNAVLKQILQSPRNRTHPAIVKALTNSTRAGIIRLVLNYLESDPPLHPALNVIATRTDLPFLRRLLQKVGPEPSRIAARNIKRLERVTWLQGNLELLKSLDDAEQDALVGFAVGSGMKRQEVFEVIRFLINYGTPGGRRAAAKALDQFTGVAANDLALRILGDEDPHVKASALRQLRHRGVPGAMNTLLEHVDHPHEEVRRAVQESLGEFSYDRFQSSFEILAEDVRRSTGALVRKIDPNVVTSLCDELESSSRNHRLRALELAPYLGLIGDVESKVIELLDDSDHFVRAEAANALGHCNNPKARDALRQAMLDRSPRVQEAAEKALQSLTRDAVPLPVPAVDGSALETFAMQSGGLS